MHCLTVCSLAMQKSSPILGINLGAQKIGFAVLRNSELLRNKVSSFHHRWSEKKLQTLMKAIEKIRVDYGAAAVSLKVPHSSHHTQGLKSLICSLMEFYKSKGILLHMCTIKELKRHSIEEGRKNKKVLVQDMAAKYPDLHIKAKKE